VFNQTEKENTKWLTTIAETTCHPKPEARADKIPVAILKMIRNAHRKPVAKVGSALVAADAIRNKHS
jgi:hypothetical protein